MTTLAHLPRCVGAPVACEKQIAVEVSNSATSNQIIIEFCRNFVLLFKENYANSKNHNEKLTPIGFNGHKVENLRVPIG